MINLVMQHPYHRVVVASAGPIPQNCTAFYEWKLVDIFLVACNCLYWTQLSNCIQQFSLYLAVPIALNYLQLSLLVATVPTVGMEQEGHSLLPST